MTDLLVVENPNQRTVVVDQGATNTVAVSGSGQSLVVTDTTSANSIVITETVFQDVISPEASTTVVITEPQRTNVFISSPGPQGPVGEGIPTGGVQNDIIIKNSSTDYDVSWSDAPTLDAVIFDQTANETPSVGKLSWNTTDGTLNLGLTGGEVTLQIGQEQVVRIRNNTGSTITNGQVVYVTGALGQRPTVALASAVGEGTSSKTFGVATEDIPNNSEGFIATAGLVRGVATNAFNEGDALYLSSTAGAFTNVKPQSPLHLVNIGWVIKKAGVDDGSIFVHVQNGFELPEIHDVLISTPKDGDVLQYDGLTDLWKNGTGEDKSPTFTYTAGLVTRIDYTSGNYKTLSYTAGVLTQTVYVLSGRTITKNFSYNGDGTLASITQSETYN